jgi:malonyl-CoA O-methyltransferase
MPTSRPPTIDPVAAQRWDQEQQYASPWLHDEVARRMQERLDWIKLQPAQWVHWSPSRGGLAGHALVAQRYPKAECYVTEPSAKQLQATRETLRKPWWSSQRWAGPAAHFELPASQSAQMLWANMALHMAADPQALINRWHQALAVDGFLMFSCLGPDSLREIRAVYQRLGWPAASHEFTDMHDWGDMLVAAGFAEPVLDMERIVLTFATPQRLLAELRTLGRNLHPARFPSLRGRAWLKKLQDELRKGLTQVAGRSSNEGLESEPLSLTFEVIYGHALKPRRKLAVSPETKLSLDEMRQQLKLP